MTKPQYNYCLDFIKGIACIFVVFMHCEFPGVFGTLVQAISRFCVPFFFMVSGYFCYRPLVQASLDSNNIGLGGDSQIIKRKVIHIAKITLYASLFYLAFVFLQQFFLHNQVFSLSGRQLLKWLIFNEPRIIAGQYWFLFALLYAYIFYGILESLHLRKIAYLLATLMFVIYIALAQGAHLCGIWIPNFIYRNWLIEAFPYFMLGYWIHENQNLIKISNKSLLAIITVTTLLCLVERWAMGRDFGVNIVTIPQVFALFVYGVKNPSCHSGVLQRIGRDCSMMIYILHPAVWHTIDGTYELIGIGENVPAQYLKPVLVLGFSILFALLFNGIVGKTRSLDVKTN